ncbi:MAG TPA: hypothetical protein VH988_19715 [Thermoanaerobaculia bacterium]|jgi:hypothetical protein|nr:hypothetical protein [Thermoanaerobaculia bacterium]
MSETNISITVNFTNTNGSPVFAFTAKTVTINTSTGRITYTLLSTAGVTFAANPIEFVGVLPVGVRIQVLRPTDTTAQIEITRSPSGTNQFGYKVVLQGAGGMFTSPDPTIVIMRPDGS